jgi:hypothetical protein
MREPAPYTVENPPEAASQSLLVRMDACPFSAALYCDHKDSAQTPEQARGEAWHDARKRAVDQMYETGEATIPPEVMKDLVQAVIEERTDLAVPAYEQDVLRAMAWRWAERYVLDLEAHVGTELMLTLEVGDWTIRGMLDDFAIAADVGYINDDKTGLGMPSQEDFERQFQLPFYALLAYLGKPEGEDQPLGRGLAGFWIQNTYPRIRGREGEGPTNTLVHRRTFLEIDRVIDTQRTVIAYLAKLEAGLKTNKWVAQAGGHCRTCPAEQLCPIDPVERAQEIGDTLATPAEAEDAGELILRADAELKRLKKGARAYAEDHDAFLVGDTIFELAYSKSETIAGRGEARGENIEAIKGALTKAELEPDDFFTTKESTRFQQRRVKPDDLDGGTDG